MTKKEMQQRIIKDGKPLDLDKFECDEETNTLSIKENYCTIDCGYNCTIKCGSDCTIDCGSDCTINCGSDCTINCYSDCTINCYSDCIIKGGSECVVVRRDIYEVIELKENRKIKLNGCRIKGYSVIEDESSLSGKEVEVKLDGKVYKAIIK